MIYLDSSALIKLIHRERESTALYDFVTEAGTQSVSSVIAEIEVLRAVRRARLGPEAERRARSVIAAIGLIELDSNVAALASQVGPPTLRSLDAIHLASALSVAEAVEAFVAYDLRLVDAAAKEGLSTLHPE